MKSFFTASIGFGLFGLLALGGSAQAQVTQRVSVATGGAQGDGGSFQSSISADGRYVAFISSATNLVTGDTNATPDVFVRDRQSGTTILVRGIQGNGTIANPSISGDASHVAFDSNATNLVAGDTNGARDVFVIDLQSGATTRVSVNSNSSQGNADSLDPSISADGRYVAFSSQATNLVLGDTNGSWDVFVHDLQTGMTTRVSIDSNGNQGNAYSLNASISADGRYVAFDSLASNLVPGDTNGTQDIFIHDRQTGITTRLGGVQGGDPSISADARLVAFSSASSNLVPGDTNGAYDVFVYDVQTGTITRASISSNGIQGNNNSSSPSISADGRYIAFESDADNLVLGDTNGFTDVFVRDRFASGFTSLCDPGVGGVLACPCSNLPSGPGRGCDNSSATGGAILSASGISYLSMDSLVFTTSGENSTATSIVMQGNALAANGLAFGQGVRCVGGTLKRLYTKVAIGGSITAPNFGAGDPTVSARSAALGDMILSGQSRWYLVYYRDPFVLGGCPASSTFNATQTGRIDWSL